MKQIFDFVYKVLMVISNLTGFSYKEVNIIIWFIIIPFSWCFLIDKARKQQSFKIIFAVFTTVILINTNNFSEFSDTLFNQSTEFLRSFNTIGSDYIMSSVIICILLPIIIYYLLIKQAYFNKTLS